MNEQEHLDQVRSSFFALLRARLNTILFGAGIGAAGASARLMSLAVILILGLNIFLLLNIGVALLIGEYIGSWGLGFLVLVGFYTLLLTAYCLLRRRAEAQVQDRVARQVHRFSDNLNSKLNEVEQLQVAPAYREAFISGEPYPYHALRLRVDEAQKQAERATEDLKRGVQYLKSNYMKVFGSLAQTRVPSLRYIAPLLGIVRASKKPKPQAISASRRPAPVGFLERNLKAITPYVPYISTLYQYLSPVVSAFVVGKTQSWLVGKLLGRNKNKTKR